MGPVSKAVLGSAALLVAAGVGGEACTYDWGLPNNDTNGDGGGGADAPFDSTTSDGPLVVDATTPPLPSPCKSSSECTADRYCRFPDRECGKTGLGTCEIVPTTPCTGTNIVCSCGGKTYSSACKAMLEREDTSDVPGSCTPPPSTFACGSIFCLQNKQFCVTKSGSKPEYDCVSFSGACNPVDCTCSTITDLGCPTCDDTKFGQVAVKCN